MAYKNYNNRDSHRRPTVNIPDFDFQNKSAFFDKTAKEISELLNNEDKIQSSQLRKFYNEFISIKNRLVIDSDSFENELPYIKLIKAKVSYARNRNQSLVGDVFVTLMNKLIDQINSYEDFITAQEYFEAIVAYYKGR